MALEARARIGRYEILARLGAGGMGEVYRAHDPRLGREVAIKVLPEELCRDPERLRRFEKEARTAGSLNHPNVLAIHDLGRTEQDAPFLVSELLEGETLRERLRGGGLSVREILDYAQQVAHGLAAAHERGVVHRDLKPENLFLTRDGRVKILDFGLAKLARRPRATASQPTAADSGMVLGTASYMSPEQVRHLAVDPRSDIFSLGVVIYELLARERPFRGGTAAETMSAILRDDPAPLASLNRDVPPSLEALVGRCLAKRPADRLQTSRDLALALEAVAADGGPASRVRPDDGRSPYPGLASFSEADAEVFFGREAEVVEVWRKLQVRYMLGLIGPSGAGKTSFLRAGLLPALPEGWRALICQPGDAPYAALARALQAEAASDAAALRELERAADPDSAVTLMERWRKQHDEVLLVVDAFEELFTLNPIRVQERFSRLLRTLVTGVDVHVLLSLRDDFLIRCNAQPSLAPVFSELTPLTAPTGAALRRALVQPALDRGYRFEDEALADEMLDQVSGERGALPLLAFAAARLWEWRDRDRLLLTREAYQRLGGVEGALAQHAEATLERIGGEREELVRELFRNLVTAQGTRVARDRNELLSVFEVREAAEQVLDRLVEARLLTSFEVKGSDDEPRQRIEVVHESLLTVWPRLARWRAQDVEGAQMRDDLRQAARRWQQRGRPDDLLWSGRTYRELQLWRERYPGGLTEAERDFTEAMQAHARRRQRRRRAGVGAAFLALSLALAGMTALQRRTTQEVRLTRAARLIALGRIELDRDPTAALAYALASLEITDTRRAREFAHEVLWRGPPARVLPITGGFEWREVALSPDGRWLAASGFADTVRVWADDGSPAVEVPVEPGGSVRWIGFLPGSRGLLTMNGESTLRLFSIPGGHLERVVEARDAITALGEASVIVADPAGDDVLLLNLASGHTRPFGRIPTGVAFAVQRERLLTLTSEGYVVSRALHDSAASPRHVGQHAGAWWIAAASHGDRILTANRDEIRIWRLGDQLESDWILPAAQTASGDTSGPRLDARGRWVAGADRLRGATLAWNLDDPPGTRPLELRAPSPAGRSLDGPGDWLAVAHGDRLTLWSLAVPRPRILDGHAGRVLRVRFAPDGTAIYSASIDGSVREWPLSATRERTSRTVLNAPGAWAYAVSVSPDGRWVLGGFTAGPRLLLADLAHPDDPPRRLAWPGGTMAIGGAAFSPDGHLLVVASNYSTEPSGPLMRTWDLDSGTVRDYPLRDPVAGTPAGGADFAGGIWDLAFTGDGRLFSAGSGGVREWDLEAGTAKWRLLSAGEWVRISPSIEDGRMLARLSDGATAPGRVELLDLESGRRRPLPSHGDRVDSVALDPTGTIAVSADVNGWIRVGRVDDSEPHLLMGHEGGIRSVAVSPDGSWIVSGGWDGTVRLWRMPDLDRPPFHTLPREELLGKLRRFTNQRVVASTDSPSGYRRDLAPFPGWRDAPTW